MLHHTHLRISSVTKYKGFTLIKSTSLDARPIVDQSGKVFSVHAGHLDDSNWMVNVYDPAGNFGSLTDSNTHGTGQMKPSAFVNSVINTATLVMLLMINPFIRLAGFATGIFENWAPWLYDYYIVNMHQFYQHNPHLKWPFLNGIFSACTFNLEHRDFANLAFGWCAITALGNFDWKKGATSYSESAG
ncbi:hypothetical protein C8J57DRAFT_1533803 [Mycena rebaudengoi]|nr:hypothetical protein C8J57DRAFT_1533803 [Mycena rebaudengoi]